ncbi:MAG: helix-turn-helix transcriptional regulator [Planctomycetes bacterium]|nr:helix-turn-helix transcriptional regulator [Planctomycetota bacterium]
MPEPSPRSFLCGLDAALRLIGAKWKPLILHFLYSGPKRYGELKRCVAGVTDKVLIQQLKDLEAHGVVSRTDHQEIPPRVDYALTEFGRGLADALKPLCEWGERQSTRIARALS